jgi:malate dehydrogenase (oxaloacetate-decarboxylating)
MDYNEESLKLHREQKGKIEIKAKSPVKNKQDLSVVYTPGVAEPCRKIFEDKNLARELTIKNNSVAVVSDGSAVLGLGNIGAEAAIPVMEGKSVLFKELANIDAFPICIKTREPEEIINIVKNISPVFGGINLEDISAPKCFYIEEKLKKELDIPVMHDDQHGTAVVVLGALINSLKLVRKKFHKTKIVINGAGAAGTAIVKLLTSPEFKKEFGEIDDILILDSKGIICKDREDLNEYKKELSEITNKENLAGDLNKAIENSDIFIGVSVGNVLREEMVKKMNKDSVVFAMANPVPEIMPDDAKKAGAKIVGTGRSDFPNQINNVLAFPGIFRGVLNSGKKEITTRIKIESAKTLANCVSENELNEEKILPDPLDKSVALKISEAIKN